MKSKSEADTRPIPDRDVKGRFAPSPSGRMHLGNVCAALLSWHSVKSRGGKWLLRIEDLDPQRSRPEYAIQIEEDLIRLGLLWDEGGIAEGCQQSLRGEIYQSALDKLIDKGLIYPCSCSRHDILATQAPHQSDGRVVYSGKCRPEGWGRIDGIGRMICGLDFPIEFTSAAAALRILVADEEIAFNDLICGPQKINPARECGDFIVRRKDGAWAYQLAVVVDDALMGVTEVVRGEDLLLSTAQQIYLYRLLGFEVPEFAHFPLIRNNAGQRLSKRDKSSDLGYLFERFSPEEIIGEAAYLVGLRPTSAPVTPQELL